MEKRLAPEEKKVASRTSANPQKLVFVKDFDGKATLRTSLLVKQKEIAYSKNGKPYLILTLSDSTGDLDSRVWEEPEHVATTFQEGDIVAVAGKTHVFQNRLQLVVEHIVPLDPSEVNLADYLPVSPHDLEARYEQLLAAFRGLSNPWISRLGLALLEDPQIAERYKLCPAAKTIHHAFVGGLLCHSLQLVQLVDAILPLYPDIDRSILIFGAAFHDFGKIYELSYQGRFGYTDEGRLVGHIAIATALVDRKIRQIPEFPESLEWQLKHLILSHHGKLEYGSPKRPHTIEAQVLHSLDDMDSKINSIQTFMKAENSGSRWTGYHRAYDQYYYKPDTYLPAEDPAHL